jgi:3-oxoacyl-[acyl-carrier-protein] synthase II
VTVITGWSAVSAYGAEAGALAQGVAAGRAAVPEPDTAPALVVPGFDARAALGAKGTRSMDRVSGLAVLAARNLVRDLGEGAATGDRTGLVLGVSNGSAQSMVELTRDSMLKDRPELVKPAQFPNTLMNAAAAQCAIWLQLRGPNATLAGGRTAGLLALRYAARLQRAGRAEAVLSGAAEEYSETRVLLDGRTGPGVPLGEGCAMVLLEPAAAPGRPVLAELVGCAFEVFADAADAGAALTRCVDKLVDGGERPWMHAAAHDAALPDLSDVAADERVSMTDLLGDTEAASAALGIAAVLALAAADPASAGRTALVTAADRDGGVGAALLRLAGPA